jgi:hypothetical protein
MIRPGSTKATNNDNKYLDLKVTLRYNAVKDNLDLKILDCFAGKQVLWSIIEKKIGAKTNRLTIDADANFKPNVVYDSLKWIKENDLSSFDIIDLDSWGSPVKHLEVLFNKKYKGLIIATYCSPVNLNPDKILAENYFKKIYGSTKKVSILNKDIGEMFKLYLYKNGVTEYKGLVSKKKIYCSFIIK